MKLFTRGLGVLILTVALTLQLATDYYLLVILLLWIYVVIRNAED